MSLFTPQAVVDLGKRQVGRLGELITTYYLELYGIHTEIVRGFGCDLWCTTPEGFMFTVEVKTGYKPFLVNDWSVQPRYRFNISSDIQRKADVHAFVGLDIEGVIFEATQDIPDGGKKTLSPEALDQSYIFPSIESTLKRLTEIKKAA